MEALINSVEPGSGDPKSRPLFDVAFEAHASPIRQRFDIPGGRVPLMVASLGSINIVSGRLVACDPLSDFEAEALQRSFPNGDFPVRVVVADLGGAPAIAMVRIDFSDELVTQWQEDTSSYINVDAGIIALFDPGFSDACLKLDDPTFEAVSEKWIEALEQVNSTSGLKFACLVHHAGHSAAFCSTGDRDGAYLCWYGFDEDARLAAMLVDFEILCLKSK